MMAETAGRRDHVAGSLRNSGWLVGSPGTEVFALHAARRWWSIALNDVLDPEVVA
jgi:hypothetical protein